MNQPQRFGFFLCAFLILLRLSIGWHFFISGADKLESRWSGEETSAVLKPWTSASFLQNSTGPLKDFFRTNAGDPDMQALAWLNVKEPTGEELNGKRPLKDLLSPALNEQWNSYTQRFIDYYSNVSDAQRRDGGISPLSDEQKQQAQNKLDQAKEIAAQWLLGRNPKGTPTYAIDREVENRVVSIPVSVPDQIQRYREKLAMIQAVEEGEKAAFSEPVSSNLPKLKAEARTLRTTLTSDLNNILTTRLDEILTSSQKKLPQVKSENLSLVEPTSMVQWTDTVISWGLTIIGACLVLGLLTRWAALLGALFLISVFVVAPPAQWTELGRAEGPYLIMYKNILMLLALFALAFTPSGRWFGLDGLLFSLNPFGRKKDQTA